jgi:beta-lactamase class A
MSYIVKEMKKALVLFLFIFLFAGLAASQGVAKAQFTSSSRLAKTEGVPSVSREAAARKFALSRQGIVSFTVINTLRQRYSFYGSRQFVSASVVKAMLITCFLNNKAIHHQALTVTERTELKAMITLSDNNAADWVYQQVGNARLDNLARRLGMKHFSVSRWWTYAQLTTDDQSLLMGNLKRAIYPPYYNYARLLLSSVVSWESWGIPRVARPLGWKVFFKGGWRGTDRGQLVHQVARLEKNGKAIVICVFTDGDPSMAYGEATIAGITSRLLK